MDKERMGAGRVESKGRRKERERRGRDGIKGQIKGGKSEIYSIARRLTRSSKS